jgi:hypothetical protein
MSGKGLMRGVRYRVSGVSCQVSGRGWWMIDDDGWST